MSSRQQLTTATVAEVFAEEITSRSGVVLDTVQDGTRLFTRSILPSVREVLPDDKLQGGVALRGTESEVWLHPYVFRIVCSNGAIMAHALQTQHLTELDQQDPDDADAALREAIQACCVAEAFATSVREFRTATETQADLALNLSSVFSRLRLPNGSDLLRHILDQFFAEPDRSRFGLTNAITSVARDTRDPEVRWRLEELGGAVAAGRISPPPALDARVRKSRRRHVAVA